jgi:hypothetical protein
MVPKRPSGRAPLSVAICFVVALVAGMVNAAPATAAESPPVADKNALVSAAKVNKNAPIEAELAWSTAAPATPQLATIRCGVRVNWPHPSGHVPGRINVDATISCTAPMTSLAMIVGLFDGFGNLISWNVDSNSGRSYIRVSTNGPCVDGVYFGAAYGVMVPPAGYFPPWAVKYVQSPFVYILC